MTHENRKFSRVIFWGRGELTVAGVVYPIEQVVDLSLGGCHFSLQEEVYHGELCVLKMFLGDGQVVVETEGEIAWVGEDKVGVTFTAIKPDDLIHLRNIIRYNAADSEKVQEEMREHPGIK